VTRRGPRTALLAKEARELLLGPAPWPLLLGLSLLVGASFRQAVHLYSEVSRAAVGAPEMGAGLSPFEGVLVPTFGALYLATTLLWPFVAIRQLAGDVRSGALGLVVQTPLGLRAPLAAKVLVLVAAFLVILAVPLSAAALWRAMGGHVSAVELLGLAAGHLLYAVIVIGLSLAATAWTDSAPAASLVVLGATVGSWALDFAAAGQGGPASALAAASLTDVLRPWERGLFLSANTVRWSGVAAILIALAAVRLRPGLAPADRLGRAGLLVAAGIVVVALSARVRPSFDFSENMRNSFDPGIERALAGLTEELHVNARLSPEDPRSAELERALLSKLRRSVKRLRIEVASDSGSSFGPGEDERYGEVVYAYAGRSETSRSTSPREVVPIILGLAQVPVPPPSGRVSGGHPLVARDAWSGPWFYGILPGLVLAGAVARRRRLSRTEGGKR
jgi:ABC-2 type transport system permease protein